MTIMIFEQFSNLDLLSDVDNVENMIKGILFDLEQDFIIQDMRLTGSFAADLCTSSSDVDLIAIARTRYGVLEPAYYEDRDFIHEGRLWDVEVLTPNMIGFHLEAMKQSIARVNYFRVFELRRECRVATRLLMSHSFIGNELNLGDAAISLMRRRTMALFAADGMTFVRDVAGLLREGDVITATEASIRALKCACEMLLIAIGNYNYSGKFVGTRLMKSRLPRNIAELLVDLLYGGASPMTASPEITSASAKTRVHRAAQIAHWSQLFGWDQVADSDDLLQASLSRTPVDEFPKFACRSDDGVIFFGPSGSIEASVSDLAVSYTAQSVAPSELKAVLSNMFDMSPEQVRAWIPAQLEALRNVGLA